MCDNGDRNTGSGQLRGVNYEYDVSFFITFIVLARIFTEIDFLANSKSDNTKTGAKLAK